jgi:hypothetical protein
MLTAMGRVFQTNWSAIKQDFCQDPTLSQQQLAAKWGVSYGALRGRCYRDNWPAARESYAAQYAEKLQQLTMRQDAAALIRGLNDKQFKQSDELRVMLNMKLKMRDGQGKIVVRPDVSIIELRCACAAFAELFRMDRLALGASTDNVAVASTQSRYDDMTEEQLMEELRQVRKRVTIQ